MIKKRILFLILAVLIVWAFPSAVLAGDDPLALESSSIKDGQTDVPVDKEIELVFSNNVVNQSVAENNKKCIKLLMDGYETWIEVVMADDQIAPAEKRIIKVKPDKNLIEGQIYELVIKGGLKAKNGNSLGKDTVISFTTKGALSWIWLLAAAVIVIIAAALFIIIGKKHGSKKAK